MNFWRKGEGLEWILFMTRSLELRAHSYALNLPPRAAASFNTSIEMLKTKPTSGTMIAGGPYRKRWFHRA